MNDAHEGSAMAIPPKRKGFRAFVERHDSLFTVLGAGIAFLGFFVKEGYKETAKDVASSIKILGYHYVLVQRLVRVQGDLNQMQHRLLTIQYPESSKYLVAPIEEGVTSSSQMFALSLDGFGLTRDLLAELPFRADKLAKEQKGLQDEINDLNALQIVMLEKRDLLDKINDADQTDTTRKLLVHDAAVASDAFAKPDILFWLKEDKFNNDVIAEATSQLERQELRVTIWTYISYTLFILGWGMGLIGKVWKLPALGGGGEA
jgi:hypothetical protein